MQTNTTTVYLSTAYLAPIEYYMQLKAFPEVCIERHCNYMKQTYRNRCVIASANGPQTLSIPVEKTETLKSLTKDIRIAEHGNWRHLHWNAIISAYNSTPFFEYYEDDFAVFYEHKQTFLFDFNESLRELVCELLGIQPHIRYTSEYKSVFSSLEIDYREVIHPKKTTQTAFFKPYYQVFDNKSGFQSNLSIIDLLFNMGPESILWI